MKKIICVLLSLILTLPGGVLVSAKADTPQLQYQVLFNRQTESEQEELTKIGETFYYYFGNDVESKCISYDVTSGFIDQVEYTKGEASFFRVSSFSPNTMSEKEFLAYSREVKRTKNGNYYNCSDFFTKVEPTRSLSPEAQEKILDEFFDNGYLHPYVEQNTRVVVTSGVPVIIRDSLGYNLESISSFAAVASTLLSVICAFFAESSSVILSIASFVSAGYGVYSLITDVLFEKANAQVEWLRNAYISDICYYQSWKRENWKAMIGDLGCALSYHDGVRDTVYYNDPQIADIAYANWQAGYPYPI